MVRGGREGGEERGRGRGEKGEGRDKKRWEDGGEGRSDKEENVRREEEG